MKPMKKLRCLIICLLLSLRVATGVFPCFQNNVSSEISVCDADEYPYNDIGGTN